jgi:hypothetical protein
MTISDEELDELKRLLEKASESPWRAAGKSSGYIFAPDRDGTVQVGVIGSYRDLDVLRFNKERWDADRNLIVFLRNLAPRLLSHYRSARNDGIEEAATVAEDTYDPNGSLGEIIAERIRRRCRTTARAWSWLGFLGRR